MEAFAAALVGAILGGLVGAVAGFKLQSREFRRREVGSSRALFFEASINAALCRFMAAGSAPAQQLSQATWLAAQSSVAALLPPEDLGVVARAYGMLPLAQHNIDTAMKRSSWTPDDLKILLGVADEFSRAVAALRPHAWSDEEQARLTSSVEAP